MTGRPDPDELLARVREEESKAKRGKLTVFFGAAPGVGKTYAMLEAARAELAQGRDVVVGVVETHGRYDTGALTIGLELLGRRSVTHRGVTLAELDLDAVLGRKPEIVLIDELAHTNAPGSRHTKRWQDVEELLDAGIDVMSTLNVQHIESLNDLIAQITGVVVRETVPDSVIDEADEIHLVDLPPEDLLERLREGKVYMGDQAAHAALNFFREGNLIALRELALRRTAERVDAQMRGYKIAHGIHEAWAIGELVLVCVSPSPHSARLIRAAKRMATSLHAKWLGVYVDSPSLRVTARDRERLDDHMLLVEKLGGEGVTLQGDDAATEIVAFARKRNVTKIVLGKPTHARWRDLFKRRFLDDVVRRSAEIDVYVISGEDATGPKSALPLAIRPELRVSAYAASVAVVLVSTAVSWKLFGRTELADVSMTLLLGVVVVAMRFGYGPSLAAAVLSVLAFDFFFIPPYLSFAVADLRHVVTFAVMLIVAFVISNLTRRIRVQADLSRERERRTATLYAVSRELAATRSREVLLGVAARHLAEVFDGEVAVLLPKNATLELAHVTGRPELWGDKALAAANWVFARGQPAGKGTDTLPMVAALFVPIVGSRGKVGVLGIAPKDPKRLRGSDQRQLVETLAGLMGSAIERTLLADEAKRAELRIETEQLRNSLLSSVSHDLRTPLSIVTGAASALLDDKPKDRATERELVRTIHEEANRLARLVRNLLDMTRLEAGALEVRKEWQPFEEVVGSALARVEDALKDREVVTKIGSELVPLDAPLMEQVLINLLENAVKYTPPKTPIEIVARKEGNTMVVEVSDRGPGVPPEKAGLIFEKFYRGREDKGGVGLGLTICRGIVKAHGGTIDVKPREGGGATFYFSLPLEAAPTKLDIPSAGAAAGLPSSGSP